jgi:alkaline phosphatase
MKRLLTPVLTLLLASTLAAADRPRNVILLVGDGMGPAQLTAAKNARGKDFQIGRMPVVGLVATQSADAAVTDSAAAATAYATGVKTNNGMVSVDPAGANLRTVGEAAHDAGKKIGVVTTTGFWDATPAAFLAHAKKRYDEAPQIIRQIIDGPADLAAGSGLDLLGQKGLPTLAELKSKVAVATTAAELQASKDAPRVIALFPMQKYELDAPEAPLPTLATWAIDRLDDDPDGFFLLLEHEGIDGATHNNSAADTRAALESFDRTVGVALDFAAAHPDTLVLVVGDHETGGMRLTETRELRRWRMEWSTGEHTGTMVPILAYGAGASAFAGIQENTEVGSKLLALMQK